MTPKKTHIIPAYAARPCLVIGTGFHRWVLGDSLISQHTPLVSWNELILQTAQEMGVSLRRPEDGENLALHWEELLSEAQTHGVKAEYDPNIKKSQNDETSATYQYEEKAKNAAVKILKNSSTAYPRYSSRSQYPMEDCWGSVISLNFDSHWLDDKRKWMEPMHLHEIVTPAVETFSKMAERRRLTHAFVSSTNCKLSKRLWFPNGHISEPNSLRMGFRDFGFQPSAVYEAYTAVKVFERKQKIEKSELHRICAKLLDGDSREYRAHGLDPLPLSWVTEMLYRPVFFAGVGMSDAEVGLWWLMVQRARNLAKIHPAVRPRVYLLLHENDTRLDFWKTHPCGIEPVVCSNWDAGWAEMKRKAEALCDFK